VVSAAPISTATRQTPSRASSRPELIASRKAM
jgi:hypothetical protein